MAKKLIGFPFDQNFATYARNLGGQPGSNVSPNGAKTNSRLAAAIPRLKFTYLVEFVLSQAALSGAITNVGQFLNNGRIYGQINKIDLPKISYKNEKLRSYNKWVNVPTAMEYLPATMTFHSDSTSTIAALKMDYMNYYSESGNIGIKSPNLGSSPAQYSVNSRLAGSGARAGMEERSSMGIRSRADGSRCFFDAIIVHDLGTEPDSVNQHVYIYPTMVNIDDDTLDHDDGSGRMLSTWTFEYEGYAFRVGQSNASSSYLMSVTYGDVLTPSPSSGHAVMTPSTSGGGRAGGILSAFSKGTSLGGILQSALGGGKLSLPNPLTVFGTNDVRTSDANFSGRTPTGSTIPSFAALSGIFGENDMGIPDVGTVRQFQRDQQLAAGGLLSGGWSLFQNNHGVSANSAGNQFTSGYFSVLSDNSYMNPYQWNALTGDERSSYNEQIDTAQRYSNREQERIQSLQEQRQQAIALNPDQDTSYWDTEIRRSNNQIDLYSATTDTYSGWLERDPSTSSAASNTSSFWDDIFG